MSMSTYQSSQHNKQNKSKHQGHGPRKMRKTQVNNPLECANLRKHMSAFK